MLWMLMIKVSACPITVVVRIVKKSCNQAHCWNLGSDGCKPAIEVLLQHICCLPVPFQDIPGRL